MARRNRKPNGEKEVIDEMAMCSMMDGATDPVAIQIESNERRWNGEHIHD